MSILVNDSKLWNLLQSEENDKLDFKSAELLLEPDSSNRYKIAKHIVGFANHRGGSIVFGVADDGIPEGENLLEEECLATISEIVTDNCSPIVEFSHEYYSEDRGDLSAGSVFVLNIAEKAEAPPVAIIDNSNGKIRKREYRIRSGESTRLVSDGELLALFIDEHDLELRESFSLWYTHNEDFSPMDVSPAPTYYPRFDTYFEKLQKNSADILDSIARNQDDENYNWGLVTESIACYEFLGQLFSQSQKRFENRLLEICEDKNISPGYNFESVSPEAIEVDSWPELIDKFPFGFYSGVLMNRTSEFPRPDRPEPTLFLPQKGSISINSDFSQIIISVENEFKLEIDFAWRMTTTGLPSGHPDSVSGFFSFDSNVIRPKLGFDPANLPEGFSVMVQVSLSAEFNYPSQTQGEYVASREYCETIINELKSGYDWNNFIEEIPEKKLYDIENTLFQLQDSINSLAEQVDDTPADSDN